MLGNRGNLLDDGFETADSSSNVASMAFALDAGKRVCFGAVIRALERPGGGTRLGFASISRERDELAGRGAWRDEGLAAGRRADERGSGGGIGARDDARIPLLDGNLAAAGVAPSGDESSSIADGLEPARL